MRGKGRLPFLAFCLLWVAACAGSGSADDVSSSTSDVDVALAEWSVTPSPDSVSSGQVTFNASNDGTKTHNLLIVKDIAPADLPTEQRGYVAEAEIPEGALIGRITEVDTGTTQSATFPLTPGSYTIFCNVVDDFGSHFAAGMVATLDVAG